MRTITRERAVAGSTQRAAAEGIVAHRAHAEAEWSRVLYAEIPEDAAECSLLLDSILTDSLADVTAGQRAALIETLAEQLWARAQADPLVYVRLAEGDPTTRWLTEADQPGFTVIGDVFEHHTGKGREGFAPRDALLALVRFAIEEYDSRLAEVATEEGGSLVWTYRVRNNGEVVPKSVAGHSDEASAKWHRNASTGQMFRVPRVSIDDVCIRDGSALVIEVNLLVKTESGRPFNWMSTWYWDKESGEWLCNRMLRKGWHATMWY